MGAYLETEIHDCECEVVPCLCSVLREVVEVVVQLVESEQDQPQKVGPYVDRLVGEDTGTARRMKGYNYWLNSFTIGIDTIHL